MNIERLLDHILEANDAYEAYAHTSAQYRARHGHGVFFGNRKLDEEERRIEYLYHDNDRQEAKLYAIMDVLDFDSDQRARAYTAARSIRRWYEDTGWEKLPSGMLLSRLNNFVIGG